MQNFFSRIRSAFAAFMKDQDRSKFILRIVTLIALGLMLIGLLDESGQAALFSLPGPATLSIGQMVQQSSPHPGLAMMSAGILLFALLPSLRVLMGINQFIRHHEIVNVMAAIIVFAELAVGILMFFQMKGVLT